MDKNKSNASPDAKQSQDLPDVIEDIEENSQAGTDRTSPLEEEGEPTSSKLKAAG
jgi:hypothetical protein